MGSPPLTDEQLDGLLFLKNGAFVHCAHSYAFLRDGSLDMGSLVNPILIDFVTCLSRGCADLYSHGQ